MQWFTFRYQTDSPASYCKAWRTRLASFNSSPLSVVKLTSSAAMLHIFSRYGHMVSDISILDKNLANYHSILMQVGWTAPLIVDASEEAASWVQSRDQNNPCQ